MKLFYGHMKIAVLGQKTLVFPITGKNLGETFFSQILIHMENANVSYGSLDS